EWPTNPAWRGHSCLRFAFVGVYLTSKPSKSLSLSGLQFVLSLGRRQALSSNINVGVHQSRGQNFHRRFKRNGTQGPKGAGELVTLICLRLFDRKLIRIFLRVTVK